MVLLSSILVVIATIVPLDDGQLLSYTMEDGDRQFESGNVKFAREIYTGIAAKGNRETRAEALFRLAECDAAEGAFDKAKGKWKLVKSKFPQSKFAATAEFRLAMTAAESEDEQEQAAGLKNLLNLALGTGNVQHAEEAMFIAIQILYNNRRYHDSGKLAERYRRRFGKSRNLTAINRVAMWSAFLTADYSSALTFAYAHAEKGEINDEEELYIAGCCEQSLAHYDSSFKLFMRCAKLKNKGRYSALSAIAAREVWLRAGWSAVSDRRWQDAESAFDRYLMTVTDRTSAHEAIALYWRGVSRWALNDRDSGVMDIRAATERELPSSLREDAKMLLNAAEAGQQKLPAAISNMKNTI